MKRPATHAIGTPIVFSFILFGAMLHQVSFAEVIELSRESLLQADSDSSAVDTYVDQPLGLMTLEDGLENGLAPGLPLNEYGQEKYNAGWTLAFDNDLLALDDRDFDYTGGAAITFAGKRAKDWPISLDPMVGILDGFVPGLIQNAGRPGYPLHFKPACLPLP